MRETMADFIPTNVGSTPMWRHAKCGLLCAMPSCPACRGSSYGSLADLGPAPSAQDIDQMRADWSSPPTRSFTLSNPYDLLPAHCPWCWGAHGGQGCPQMLDRLLAPTRRCPDCGKAMVPLRTHWICPTAAAEARAAMAERSLPDVQFNADYCLVHELIDPAQYLGVLKRIRTPETGWGDSPWPDC